MTEEEIEPIVERAKEAGADHIIASSFKVRRDIWSRFKRTFPKLSMRLEPLYFKEGERIGSYWYLPKALRKRLMVRVREVCKRYNLPFSSCREGFSDLQTAATCDGSWLIRF
ncbi:MAG: hypothetical protein AB1630_05480 [bacterium]